eukprot:941650-Prymnesium_polylepis.2
MGRSEYCQAGFGEPLRQLRRRLALPDRGLRQRREAEHAESGRDRRAPWPLHAESAPTESAPTESGGGSSAASSARSTASWPLRRPASLPRLLIFGAARRRSRTNHLGESR